MLVLAKHALRDFGAISFPELKGGNSYLPCWFTILKHDNEIIALDENKYNYSTAINNIIEDFELDLDKDIIQQFISEGINRSSGTIRQYLCHTKIPKDVFPDRLVLLHNGDGQFKEKVERFFKTEAGYKVETWLMRME